MKPVDLWMQAVRDGSIPGEAVYDPFLGSGTTMVACQNLNRKCRGIEIGPNYCAVILERMGGEERILTRMTRFAEHARPYLSMTPRDRLVAVVSHWMDVLQTVRDDADDIERAMDAELLLRVSEVADRIRHGDVDGAFDVLRSASNPRPDDTNPILLPDTLDLTSACWVDLEPVN